MRPLPLVVVLAAVTAACGVKPQDAPERIPLQQAPAAATPVVTPSPSASSEVPLYLVRSDRLSREQVRAGRADLRQALDLLLGGEATLPAVAGLRTAIPVGVRLRAVSTRGRIATLDVSSEFARLRGQDQVLAVAQIVFTATEFPPVAAVVIQVDGVAVAVPTQEGAAVIDPVGRSDFSSLGG